MTIAQLRHIDFKSYVAFLFMLVLPSLYLLLRVHLLGDIPSDQGINIASQMMWVGLAYEVMQEGLLLPLYALLGREVYNNQKFLESAQNACVLVLAVFVLFAFVLGCFAKEICLFMAQQHSLIETTATYIRLESIANILSALSKLGLIILIVRGTSNIIISLTIAQVVLHFLCDILFVGQFSYSFFLGVNGLAVSSFLVHLFLCCSIVCWLKSKHFVLLKNLKFSPKFLMEWFRMGAFSGMESLLKNVIFAFMIVRMMNLISEQGTFWLANSFIWGWLLLPVLALSELIKRDVAQDKKSVAKNTLPYFLITACIACIWVVTIPFWKHFIHNVMNVADVETVVWLVKLQLPFYIVFAVTMVIHSIFYGAGRTDYILYQSVFVNVIYYGAVFGLFLMDIFTPSLYSISLVFGGGLVVDLLPTFYLFSKLLKQEKIHVFR